ncbi:MAG: hypothetical protein SGARI_002464 [Bacillariaceae sp.]
MVFAGDSLRSRVPLCRIVTKHSRTFEMARLAENEVYIQSALGSMDISLTQHLSCVGFRTSHLPFQRFVEAVLVEVSLEKDHDPKTTPLLAFQV